MDDFPITHGVFIRQKMTLIRKNPAPTNPINHCESTFPKKSRAYKRRSGSHPLCVLNDLGRAALHDRHTTVGRT